MISPPSIASLVWTAIETAIVLRVIEADATPEEAERARRAVLRLVRLRKLRPIRPSREYVFAQAEVERYIADETAAYCPADGGGAA